MVGVIELSTNARRFQEEAQQCICLARGEPEDELCTDYTGPHALEIQHAEMDRVMLSHLAVYYHG